MASGDILTYDDILFKKIPTELGVDTPLPRFSEEEEKELKKGRLPTFGDIKTKFSSIAKVINRSGVKDNLLVVNDDFVFEKNIVIDWKEKYPWLHFGPIPNLPKASFTLDKIYLTQSVPDTVYSATLIPIRDKTEFLDNPTTIIENATINMGSRVVFSLLKPFKLLDSEKSYFVDNIALWINVNRIESFENKGGAHTVLKDIYNNYYTLKYYPDYDVQWVQKTSASVIDDDNFIKMSYFDFMEGNSIKGFWLGSLNMHEYIRLGMAKYPSHDLSENLGAAISLTCGGIPIRNIMFRVRFTKIHANNSSELLLGEYGFVLQLLK